MNSLQWSVQRERKWSGFQGLWDRGLLFIRSVMSDSFAIPWTAACQAPPFMGFSRQEYWSGLPFPSPGDPPNPGIKPRSPTLQADSLPLEPQEKKIVWYTERNLGIPGLLFLMIPFCLLSFHSFSCEKLIWVWARIYLSSLLFLRSYNSYISMIIQRLFAWHTLWTNFHIFENRQLWNGTWNLRESGIKPFSPFMGFSTK